MEPAVWSNVLLSQTSFIGDSVLTLPLVAEIRRRFPVKRLTLLCSPATAQLLLSYPGIDEVLIDDKKAADRGIRGLWNKARVLQDRRFTLALTPHKSFRTALLLYLAGVPERVGFRQSKGWFLFNRRTDRIASRHDVERNLSLVRAVTDGPGSESVRLSWPGLEKRWDEVAPMFDQAGVTNDETVIGINAGSVWPTKRWPPELFALLVDKISSAFRCKCLLFGGPEDEQTAESIQKQCQASVVNLAGRFSLAQLPAAIARCRLFVTNDSGPMHVAVAADVPTVAVFCATTTDLGFYPYSGNAVVVEKELACRPCTSHGGRRCPLGHFHCGQLIGPDIVFSAVERLWRRTEGAMRQSGVTPESVAA